MSQLPDNDPMCIIDIVAHYKTNVRPNEGIMVAKIKEMNNKKIELWEKDVLVRIAVDGKVRPSEAVASWEVFEEGLNVRETMKYIDMVPEATFEQVKEWLKFFDQDLELICRAGTNVVSLGYGVVATYLRNWIAREKFKRVYQSDNPLEWIEHSKDHFRLMNGDEIPFQGMQDITLKVKCITSTVIQPH